MKIGLKRLPARFYRSDAGREPVRQWLKSLDDGDRRVIGEDIKDVDMANRHAAGSLARPRHLGSPEQPAAAPHCPSAVLRRAECMVLLQGFMKKKTQKTPKQDIDLAIKRKKGTVK
jgi:hypothetical protein